MLKIIVISKEWSKRTQLNEYKTTEISRLGLPLVMELLTRSK